LSQLRVARVQQLLDGVVEQQVSTPGELMK